MGTPELAVPTLEHLIEVGHDVCLVVTQPDKAKGRGKKMQAPPVKITAEAAGIPVFQPQRVRTDESIEVLASYQADVIVVIAFGQILPKRILELTPYGCVNVHASLLPKYRGAAPIQWAILSGEEVTGVTTMQMDEGIDTGDMLLKTEIPIEETDTGGSLQEKIAVIGASACVETLNLLQEGSLEAIPQGESTTAYASLLSKDMGNIDWSRSAIEIERWIRGLNPWPSAYTQLDEKRLKIFRSYVVSKDELLNLGIDPHECITAVSEDSNSSACSIGRILHITKKVIYVQTGDGVLAITEVQLAGKKQMPVQAFVLGYSVKVGTVLGG